MKLIHVVTDRYKHIYKQSEMYATNELRNRWMQAYSSPEVNDVDLVAFPDSYEFQEKIEGEDVYYVWHEADIVPIHPRFYELCKRIGHKHGIFCLPKESSHHQPYFLIFKGAYLRQADDINKYLFNANFPAYFKYSAACEDTKTFVYKNSWSDTFLFKRLVQFIYPMGMFGYRIEE